MIFLYLIFAHILGDFVFQSYGLVKYKKKSLFGLFLHCFIHFSISFFVIFLFLKTNISQIVIALLFVSIAHFFIDWAKIHFEKKSKKRVLPFLLDQIAHLLIIFFAAIYLSVYFKNIENSLSEAIIFISLLIILIQGVEIFNYQKSLEKNTKTKFKYSPKAIKKRLLWYLAISALYLIIIRIF